MMPRAWDFRKLGRDALAGNWMMAILVTLLAIILGALSLGNGFHFTINLTIIATTGNLVLFPAWFLVVLLFVDRLFYWRSGGAGPALIFYQFAAQG